MIKLKLSAALLDKQHDFADKRKYLQYGNMPYNFALSF